LVTVIFPILYGAFGHIPGFWEFSISSIWEKAFRSIGDLRIPSFWLMKNSMKKQREAFDFEEN